MIGPSQKNTWLAFGEIHTSRIRNIWPFDGKTLHQKETGAEIRSEVNPQLLWSRTNRMWLEEDVYVHQRQEETRRNVIDEAEEEEHRRGWRSEHEASQVCSLAER